MLNRWLYEMFEVGKMDLDRDDKFQYDRSNYFYRIFQDLREDIAPKRKGIEQNNKQE